MHLAERKDGAIVALASSSEDPMRIRTLLLALTLVGPSAFAQDAVAPVQPASEATSDGDILTPPKEFREFVIKKTIPFHTWAAKTQALVQGIFERPQDGGLGITYANDKTRTVAEVWNDRKANCMSLTAFYGAACKVMGVPAWFGDAPSVSVWVRHGDLIYNERHVVAAIPVNALNTVIADFSPVPHLGAIHIRPMTEAHFRALFHSNRAVELLQSDSPEAAIPEAQAALRDDPQSGIGWNTYGVIEQALEHPARAEEAFLKALEVDPKDGIACGNLEGLYSAAGRPQDALRYRNLGLQLRDRDPYFHAFLAREALVGGRNDEAKAEIKRAIRLQRMEPDFYLVLAQVEMNQHEHGAAAKAVEKAIHWSLPDQRKRMESKLALIQSQT